MASSSDDLARRAAQRLAPELGDKLPAQVEAQLQGGGAPPQLYDPATAIALATLLLNVAKFAWDVHRDRKKDQAPPPADTIARHVRLELPVDDRIPTERRDRIIAVVVDELLKQPPAS